MKLLKIAALGTLVAAAVTQSFADVTLKITGSTAFRRPLYSAIVAHLNSLGQGTPKAAFIGSGTAVGGANQAVFTVGTSPNKVTIQTCMVGSVGGVNWVANGINVGTAVTNGVVSGQNTAWLSASNASINVSLDGSNAAVLASSQSSLTTSNATFDAASSAKITMSDSYQDSTAFNSSDFPALVEAQAGQLGVVQFVFAKGKKFSNIDAASSGAYERFTNVSAHAFNVLASAGTAPLSLFTGVAADSAVDVVLIGRDNDSGTRLVTFAETGYGTDTTSAIQYKAFDGAGGSGTDVGTNASLTIASLYTDNGDYYGYSSGSSVKNVLNASGGAVLSANSKPCILLGYVGTGDVPTTSQVLSYHGVTIYPSGVFDNTALKNGSYSFWADEHLYYKGLSTSGTPVSEKSIADGIAQKIKDTYATVGSAGVLKATMNVNRAVEGGVIVAN